MKVKDSVHELIKSLTKSEKRCFKLSSSRHTIGDENNYVILFDFIENQVEYDECLIYSAFKGEVFLNKFSITKKRLYDHILSSLDSYHMNSSVDAQIFKMLHSADILYNKSLYEQCRTILRSADKLAKKNNRFNILLEISKKQKRLHENKGYSEINTQEIEKILKNDTFLHNQSLVYDKLWNIKSQLFILLSQKGISRTDDDILNFKKIIDDLATTINPANFYFETHYLYHHIFSAYYFAINNFESCLEHLQTNIDYFEAETVHISNQPNSYFSILTNAIFVCEKMGRFKDSTILLNKLKQLPITINMDNNDDLQIKLFSSVNSIELSSLTRRGDFEKALKLIPIIEKGFIKYGEKISVQRKAFLEFKIAVIYLSINEFGSALKWINKILNDKQLEQKIDIVSFAKLLDILIHIELKNLQLLPYTITNTQRFLKSNNRLFTFEKTFLNFVKKIIASSNLIDEEIHWEEIYDEIVQMQASSNELVAFEYFDFQSWAESKFKRKSFSKLVNDKFNRQIKESI